MSMVKYGLLGLLQEGEANGYGLRSVFSKRSGWELNHGQVYQILRRLEDSRMVNGREAPARGGFGCRTFEITGLGRAAVRTWLQSCPEPPRPFRDELLVRLFLADDQTVSTKIEQVDKQEFAYRRFLKELDAKRQELAKMPAGISRRATVLATEAALLKTRAHLRWLDYCRDVLNEECLAK